MTTTTHTIEPLEFHDLVVRRSHQIMLVSFFMIIVSMLVSYVIPDLFSMKAQIAGHLGVVIFAGLLKVGYVLNLVGHRGRSQVVL